MGLETNYSCYSRAGGRRIDSRFQAPAPARVTRAIVTFDPGVRSNWHTHPLGQTLIVTSGLGWIQSVVRPIEEIRPGDVIWCPPALRQWHGATPTSAMTHIAIAETIDGKSVDWLEPFTDELYLAGLKRVLR